MISTVSYLNHISFAPGLRNLLIKNMQSSSTNCDREVRSSSLTGIASLIAGAALLTVAFLFTFVYDTAGIGEAPRLAPKSIRTLSGARGTSQIVKLTLINRHDFPAYELVVDATCGCVIPSIETHELSPGEDIVLTLDVTFSEAVGMREVTIHTRYVVADNILDETTSLTLASK